MRKKLDLTKIPCTNGVDNNIIGYVDLTKILKGVMDEESKTNYNKSIEGFDLPNNF